MLEIFTDQDLAKEILRVISRKTINTEKNNWMSKCLLSKEKEAHLTSKDCPVYSDIREKYSNFDNDE